MDEEFELFINAIKSGSAELFRRYFKEEFLERKDADLRRPIHHACFAGHAEIVKLLIEHNCDIEALDKQKQRPIHLACYQGHSEAVKLLIENKCDIEALDKQKQRPIHLACYQGHSEAVKLLIEHKCDIEALDEWNQRPIHIACYQWHSEAVKLLIEHKCDIEALDKDNWRPIHHACDQGHSEAVKLLIDHNCDIEALDESGDSPMEIAVKSHHERIIHILNGPCLLRACKNGDLKKVSTYLNGAAIEYCDKDQRRPIHWACESGNIKVVKSLIKTKCDISARDKYNLSPLDIAIKNQNKELVELLKAEELEQQILMMGLKCKSFCNHRLCNTSLRKKTFDKGSEIGSGAFGHVYKCKGSGIDTVFAVKWIELKKIGVKCIEENINKFLPKLNHQRIIKYFGAIQTEDHLCIFMEYLSAGSLEDEIKRKRSLATENIIRYSKQILEGLEFLHGNNIIHRDIKPDNILMSNGNNIKITDFGVSRSLLRTCGNVTKAETTIGTPNFTAPEVFLTSDEGPPYTVSADIWSLGATVINMITGRPPYCDCHPFAVPVKIVTTKKLDLPDSQSMSKEMKEFIDKMLDPDPDQRSTAAQLLKLKLFSEFHQD